MILTKFKLKISYINIIIAYSIIFIYLNLYLISKFLNSFTFTVTVTVTVTDKKITFSSLA